MDFTPWERRQKLLETICLRRFDTTGNLAHEFNVSRGTILNDIEITMPTVARSAQIGMKGCRQTVAFLIKLG